VVRSKEAEHSLHKPKIKLSPLPSLSQGLGNCDIDFFISRHCFHIMRPKFQKFKRDQNATEKFKIVINESEKL
jgi:hypothetical protein